MFSTFVLWQGIVDHTEVMVTSDGQSATVQFKSRTGPWIKICGDLAARILGSIL